MKYKLPIVFAFFKSENLPPMVSEFQFHTSRKWKFDFAFIEQRVALEVEGGIWIAGGHSRGSGVKKDIEKYSEAAALGWRIIRCEPRDLCTMKTINLLKRALNYGTKK